MISSDKGLVLKMLALPCTQSTVEISLGFSYYYQKYNILQDPLVQARLVRDSSCLFETLKKKIYFKFVSRKDSVQPQRSYWIHRF